jgi:hypothetical protein
MSYQFITSKKPAFSSYYLIVWVCEAQNAIFTTIGGVVVRPLAVRLRCTSLVDNYSEACIGIVRVRCC